MNKPLDIVILALTRWDGPYSSTTWSLAKEFSRNNRVFYINNPFTVKDYFMGSKHEKVPALKKYTEVNKNLIALTPGLTIPINFLSAGFLYDTLSKFNDRVLFNTIKMVLKDYDVKDFIFINSFDPFYTRLRPKFFNPKLYIYHSVDDISHSNYVRKHGPRLEDERIREADLTLVTSLELKRLKSHLTKHIYYLPNAADSSLFKLAVTSQFDVPEELKNITKPIVIYTGHIDPRTDFDLLRYAFKSHPDKVFVMIGPSSIDKTLYDEMAALPNVVFTGKKDITQLPQYLHFAACTIIPFKCNDLTRSIYPLKVNEYLAAGKPVVSTPFSEDIMSFAGTIEIASDAESFSKAIETAIQTDSSEKENSRQSVADQNTWESRVASFWEIVRKFSRD